MFINFSDMPSQHNISLDYMYEFENVQSFYKINFRDKGSYTERFKMICESQREHRGKVAAAIENFYTDKSPSQQTIRNIDALKQSNTIAVVTGQQLGLFGGPLYTVYKTITAIKLCRSLKEQYPDYHFVPVFWMEGDDHDFNEIRYTNIFDTEGNFKKIDYHDGLDDDVNRGCMAKVKFNDAIVQTLQELDKSLRETEFKQSVLKLYKQYSDEEAGFLSGFSSLLYNMFDEFGLLLINPHSAALKELLVPVFEKEILNYSEHAIDTLEISAELEESYHAQVKVHPINLFIAEDKGRYLLEPGDGVYSLKGKRIKYTREELLDVLHSEPWKFSPNVLLRPICQDYLLPTGFYVGGPSEVAYFAQVIPLYKHYGLVQPFVFPRASATILEKPVRKVLDKFELSLMDLWDKSEVSQKVVRKLSQFNLEQLFSNAAHSTENIFIDLENVLKHLDPTLWGPVQKSKSKAGQNLEQLKNRTLKAEERIHSDALRQIQRAGALAFPNENFQEREINFIYFANKYGTDFLKFLFDELSITKFEHQIIEL